MKLCILCSKHITTEENYYITIHEGEKNYMHEKCAIEQRKKEGEM